MLEMFFSPCTHGPTMVSTIFLLKLQDLSIGELAIVVNDLKGVAFFAEEKS